MLEIHKFFWSTTLLILPLLHILLLFVGNSEAQGNVYTQHRGGGLPEVIKIGGLFDGDDATEEAAFKHAVERFNVESIPLSRFKFSAQIEHLLPRNSYLASAKVCNMMSEGIAAIFGPQSSEAASHVQSICDAFEVPHIETRWDHRIRRDNYLINLHPHPNTLSRAYNDLVEALAWEKYIIIYDESESLYKLQDLIKGSAPPKRRALLRQIPPNQDARPIFREILRELDVQKIILDCDALKLNDILKQAQQVGLMTYKFSYILTTLDIHTVDLDDFKYSEANITAFRLVDPDRPDVQMTLREWATLTTSQNNGDPIGSRGSYSGNNYYSPSDTAVARRPVFLPAGYPMQQPLHTRMIRTDTALIYDAVQLLGKALHILDTSQKIEIRSLSCDSSDMWQHGYSIINYMKMVQMQGLTGLIQFNTTGFRTDVSLDVVQLKEEGLTKIAAWDSKFVTKFNWTKIPTPETDPVASGMDLKNKTLIVTTFLTDPMTMWTRSDTPLTGNARYEGFAPDLLHRLSNLLGFKFIIKPVNDGNYGKRDNVTGEWNGMMREVLDGVADIVVADLTINKERQEAVDFTMPFMNLGITILYVVPSVKPPSLFSFMLPFSLDVWIYMAFAFFGVSVLLFFVGNISPYEWDNPFPCVQDPDHLFNQFSFLNSFWFTIGSIMQQGIGTKECKIIYFVITVVHKNYVTTVEGFTRTGWFTTIRAVSTRMIAGIWWFFTLIMVSSYTANLATFLIVQDLDESIKSLADLPKQTKAKYGCVLTGTTASFFRNSPFDLHQQIWKNMEQMNKKHKVFLQKNSEGVNRVINENGGYAFFMESTLIEYTIERNCKLAQVGGLLDSKGYGIALPKGSKYRQQFSSGILRLQESGVLDELKRKWWKEERKEEACPAGGDGDSVKPLKLANVGGVFVVLIGGCIMAVVFAFLEFFWKSRELAANAGESLVHEMWKELRFALACQGDTKQVRKKSSSSLNGGQNGSNKGSKGSNPYLDQHVNQNEGQPNLGSIPKLTSSKP